MVHWIWVLMAFIGGGFLGMFILALSVGPQIEDLKKWNRRLQAERDDARRQRDEIMKINRNLMRVEQ